MNPAIMLVNLASRICAMFVLKISRNVSIKKVQNSHRKCKTITFFWSNLLLNYTCDVLIFCNWHILPINSKVFKTNQSFFKFSQWLILPKNLRIINQESLWQFLLTFWQTRQLRLMAFWEPILNIWLQTCHTSRHTFVPWGSHEGGKEVIYFSKKGPWITLIRISYAMMASIRILLCCVYGFAFAEGSWTQILRGQARLANRLLCIPPKFNFQF